VTTKSEERSRLPGFTEFIALVLLAAAFVGIQVLIGGTRLIFALPTYGAIAVVGFLALFSIRRPKPLPDFLCLIAASLFLGYIELRAAFSPIPYLARSDIYSVLAGLVVYFFTSTVCTSAKARMTLIGVLLVTSLAQVLVAVIQFRNGDNFMPIASLQRFDYGFRGSGFYICPNHLAGLLEVLGIFGLSIVCWSRLPTWAKLFVGYAAVACYVGVILTGSRGGYLSVGASIVVFAVLSLFLLRSAGSSVMWKIGGAGAAIALVAITIAVIAVGHSNDLRSRATNVLDDKNIRLDLWRAATQQWQLAPVAGTGAGTYLIYGRMFRSDRMQLDPIYVHNDYLHLLAEYGLIGAVLLLLFLATHVRHGVADFLRLGPKRVATSALIPSNALALNIGALCAVAAYTVHSVFDFNLHIPANLLLMAFVFGILSNAGVTREKRRAKRLASPTFWRVTPAILAVVLAVQCFRVARGEYFAERARVALRDYHSVDAISYGLAGLQHDPQNPELLYVVGAARVYLGDSMNDERARDSFYRSALDAFLNGRRLAPSDETYAIEAGLTFDTLRRFEEAEWMYFDALQLDPRSTSTRQYYEAHLARWRSGGVLPDEAD